MRRRLLRAESTTSDGGLAVGALAPMVDMMTLLLVFLLRTYSSEPAPSPPEGHFARPGTAAQDPRTGALVILVSQEAIYIDGRRVIAIQYLPEDMLVREIYDRLLATRDAKRVEIHADRTIPYGVVKRVMYTARAAGVSEVALVGEVEAGI